MEEGLLPGIQVLKVKDFTKVRGGFLHFIPRMIVLTIYWVEKMDQLRF